MPSVLPESPRQRLALLGLAVPIVGLMGLFAWAGSASSGGDPSALVRSFITAYDTGNCGVMLQELYVPGHTIPSVTCKELRRPGRHQFLACSVSSPAPSSGLTVPTAPGYSDEQTVVARCQGIKVQFYVATQTSTGTTRIVGVEQAT